MGNKKAEKQNTRRPPTPMPALVQGIEKQRSGGALPRSERVAANV